MKRTTLVLLALTIGLPPAAALAQDPLMDDVRDEDPTASGELTEAEERMLGPNLGSTESQRMPLHLADAVSMGIENNLSLQVERYDPLIAFEQNESTWGAFDPTLSINGGYGSQYSPNTNVLTSGVTVLRDKSYVTDGTLSVFSLIPWLGASVEFEFAGSKTDTSQFGNFATLRPVYESETKVTGTLPLLRGLIWNEPWTRVKTSTSQLRGSQENFRAVLMDTVQFIESNYWNLVAQRESVRVAEKSLETARSLLDQTRTQYDVGVKSKVEVVEAEAGVAEREFDLILAANRYRAAQDDLIDAVLGTELTPGSRIEIVPADDPENYVSYQIDVVEAAEKAFQNRPELQVSEAEIERQEYELKFAKNQRLPQLDVQGVYGVSGTRGDDLGRGPSNSFDGDYRDSYDDWFTDQGGQEFAIRGIVSIPLGNIGARHTVSLRELELRRARTRLTQLRQQIILEVRDGARNLESAQEGIEAAERRRLAAEEQLRAEKVRLEYGESTPFRVLEKEEDLVEAENQKIFALFTYRQSVVDLHRAQGTILKARNIVVEETATLR